MDESAFAAFYEATRKPLWGYLYHLVRDPAAADDLLQEAYLRLLERAPEAGGGDPKPYLYRIAANLAVDRFRRAGRRPESPLETIERETSPPAEPGPRHDLERALGRLPPEQRSLVWLAHVEGYDHREIAVILGVGATSVRVLLFRARRKLARILSEMGLAPEGAR